MPKYIQFATMLEKRILRGDYTLDGLPTEQELADEVGVSRMTARRALKRLMDEGIFIRKPHGRPVINRRHQHLHGKASMALLAPAYSSMQYDNWIFAAERVALEMGMLLRVVRYVHWNDPVIPQSLASFEGVLLVPGAGEMPDLVLKWFSEANNLVVLDGNLTDCGVPSIHSSQKKLILRMSDYLHGLGHRRIDLLNTQPHGRMIEDRMLYWANWKEHNGVTGQVYDFPVEPYKDPTGKAYNIMTRLLKEDTFSATALMCLTSTASTGAIRALHEAGWKVGERVSVCAINGAKQTRYLIPSCTAFQHQDLEPSLRHCMGWLAGGEPWQGPLLVEPGDNILFEGESTGPAPE